MSLISLAAEFAGRVEISWHTPSILVLFCISYPALIVMSVALWLRSTLG
jgi:hypothetical protein